MINHLFATLLNIANSSGFEILPSPFLSTASIKSLTYFCEACLPAFISLRAALIRLVTYEVSRVPLPSLS